MKEYRRSCSCEWENSDDEKASKNKEYWKQIFKSVDTNCNGRLSKSELRSKLLSEGFSKTVTDCIFLAADKNRDGYLSLKEFLNMIEMDSEIGKILEGKFASQQTSKKHEQRKESKEKGMPNNNDGCLNIFSLSKYINLPWFFITLSVIQIAYYPYQTPDVHISIIKSKQNSLLVIAKLFVLLPLQHINYEYLIRTLCYQLFIGSTLEIMHRWKMIGLYVGLTLTLALYHDLSNMSKFVGGTVISTGILSANLAHTIWNWNEIYMKLYTIIGIILLGILMFLNITNTYARIQMDMLTVGFLLGLILLRKTQREPWEIYVRCTVITILSVFLMLNGYMQI